VVNNVDVGVDGGEVGRGVEEGGRGERLENFEGWIVREETEDAEELLLPAPDGVLFREKVPREVGKSVAEGERVTNRGETLPTSETVERCENRSDTLVLMLAVALGEALKLRVALTDTVCDGLAVDVLL